MDGPWKRARLVLAPSGSKNEEVSIRARDMTVWTFWPAAMRQRIACRGFFRCRFLRLGPKSSISAAGRARHLPDAIPAVVHRNIDLAREHPKRGFADQFFTAKFFRNSESSRRAGCPNNAQPKYPENRQHLLLSPTAWPCKGSPARSATSRDRLRSRLAARANRVRERHQVG